MAHPTVPSARPNALVQRVPNTLDRTTVGDKRESEATTHMPQRQQQPLAPEQRVASLPQHIDTDTSDEITPRTNINDATIITPAINPLEPPIYTVRKGIYDVLSGVGHRSELRPQIANLAAGKEVDDYFLLRVCMCVAHR